MIRNRKPKMIENSNLLPNHMNQHIFYQMALHSMRLLNWNEITGIYQTDVKFTSRERGTLTVGHTTDLDGRF